MKSGDISKNTAKFGGGLFLDRAGIFTMQNGSILENTAKDGGGVHGKTCTFTMNDGTISENTGSGVTIMAGGLFAMKNGNISKNTAAYGGGIRLSDDAALSKTGGTIYGSDDTMGRGNKTLNASGVPTNEGDAVCIITAKNSVLFKLNKTVTTGHNLIKARENSTVESLTAKNGWKE
jgi:predicted outer membrane repeat protein